MTSNFLKENTFAKEAENKAKYIVLKCGYNATVDVSENEEYQKKDIDFVAYYEGGSHTFEVKNSRVVAERETMLLEVEQIYSTYSKRGWFSACEADYLIYRDSVQKISYWFRMYDLREYIEVTKPILRMTSDYHKSGKKIKDITYYNINLEDFIYKYPTLVYYEHEKIDDYILTID